MSQRSAIIAACHELEFPTFSSAGLINALEIVSASLLLVLR